MRLSCNARKNINNSNSPSTLKNVRGLRETNSERELIWVLGHENETRIRVKWERYGRFTGASRAHQIHAKMRAASNISHYRRYLPPFSVTLSLFHSISSLSLSLILFAPFAICLSANLFWILWKTFRTFDLIYTLSFPRLLVHALHFATH